MFCALVALATGTLFDISSTHTLTRIWVASLPLTAAALMHVALVFPEEGAVIRRWPLVRFVPYPIAAVLVVVSEWRLYAAGDPRAYLPTWRLNYIVMGLAVVAFFILMLHSRSRTLSPIVRQQVRIILIGSALAFVPMAIFLALTGSFSPAGDMQFSIADTVSGRFVQQYFQAILNGAPKSGA